ERQRLQHLVESFVAYAVPADGAPAATFELVELAAEVTVLAAAYGAEHHVPVELETRDASVLVHGRRSAVQHDLVDLLHAVVDRCPKSQRVGIAVEHGQGMGCLLVRAPAEVARETAAAWSTAFDGAGAAFHADGGTLRVEIPERSGGR